MPFRLTSNRISELYYSLPLETQPVLTSDVILPLLPHLPGRVLSRALNKAKATSCDLQTIPNLDVVQRSKEITYLLSQLHIDTKRSQIKMPGGAVSSQEKELVQELVNTLGKWMEDIWSVACEWRVGWEKAHKCLMAISKVLLPEGKGKGGGGIVYGEG